MDAIADPRVGGYIVTRTGTTFYALDPRPEEIHLEDIAWALAHQCRFSGHTSKFYSVAQHSCLVHDLVDDEHKPWALFHDASEAYLIDVPRPLKRSPGFEMYLEAEERLMAAISERFALDGTMPHEVKDADLKLLVTEQRDLMKAGGDGFGAFDETEPLEWRVEPWNPIESYYAFNVRANRLGRS